MKPKYKILLFLSLALNAYFIGGMVVRAYGIYQAYKVKNVGYDAGKAKFFEALNLQHPELAGKKYYYVNMWNAVCVPCIKEMPFLDSLAGTIGNNEVGYIYVTDDSEERQSNFFETHDRSGNFAYLSDQNDFISAVCIEKNKGKKELPMHLVIDRSGKILYFKTGSYNFIELLPGHTKEQEQQAIRYNTPPFVPLIRDLK